MRVIVDTLAADTRVAAIRVNSVLTQVFPTESIRIQGPDGTAVSDSSIESLRRSWAEREHKRPQDYIDAASGQRSVYVQETDRLDNLRRRVATAMGIPTDAVTLLAPNGSVTRNPEVSLRSFRTRWGYPAVNAISA
jgi:hypothetical protein